MQEITAKQFQDQKLMDQGAFKIAINAKKILGIEYALQIYDFTKEELENEKLNR